VLQAAALLGGGHGVVVLRVHEGGWSGDYGGRCRGMVRQCCTQQTTGARDGDGDGDGDGDRANNRDASHVRSPAWLGSAALAGTGGTGGASRAACSLAVVDSCESEAWRKRSMEKRRGLGARGEAGGESWCEDPREKDGRTTSLEAGRGPSSETARRSWWLVLVSVSRVLSAGLSVLSVRLKRPAGSRVDLLFRSCSLRPGRRRILLRRRC
jgi:hypothetical protein